MNALNKSIPLMVRQARYERNQQLTVRPEPAEGFYQRFPIDLNRFATNHSYIYQRLGRCQWPYVRYRTDGVQWLRLICSRNRNDEHMTCRKTDSLAG